MSIRPACSSARPRGTRISGLLRGGPSRLIMSHGRRKVGRVVRCAVLIGLALILLVGCGGSGTSPSQVATAAGATTCDDSGFVLQGSATGANDVIYDCRFAAALPKCVTYSGRIASDATEQVSLLFARSLNTLKPVCLKWHAEALHQRQVRAAKRAARAALKDMWHGILGSSRNAVADALREVAKNA